MIANEATNAINFLLLNMIRKLPLISIVIGLLVILTAFAADKAGKSDFDASKEMIVMRNVAHQILQYTGDSTSPIAPVSRLSATEFCIPFESPFSFKPDSLVNIIDKVIANNKLPSKYIVTVRERKSDKVIYGYAVMGPEQQSIVPCKGRDQPARPYYIDIKFEENRSYAFKGLYLGGFGILGLGLVLFVVNGRKKGKEIPNAKEGDTLVSEKQGIAIGQYLFFADEQILRFNEADAILTVKEAKILSIFANAPNKIIDRKRLQKEIWEDEGVIVGRSLDMFISRLRKKLENDPDVALLNIHGKGYKLEISNKSV